MESDISRRRRWSELCEWVDELTGIKFDRSTVVSGESDWDGTSDQFDLTTNEWESDDVKWVTTSLSSVWGDKEEESIVDAMLPSSSIAVGSLLESSASQNNVVRSTVME